jgi:hypothetical protein
MCPFLRTEAVMQHDTIQGQAEFIGVLTIILWHIWVSFASLLAS